MRILYSGSFDPVTCGHLEILRRAAALFDEVVVAVAHNPAKRAAFSVAERMAMLRQVTADLPGVSVTSFEGLTADYARQIGAQALLRGLRSTADYQAEQTLAVLNGQLNPGLETLCLFSSPCCSAVSSSAVREIALFGGPLTGLVPDVLIPQIQARLYSPDGTVQ